MNTRRKITSISHGTLHDVRVRLTDVGYRVTCDDPSLDATVLAGGPDVLAVTTEDGSFEATVERDDEQIHVTVGQERFVFATIERGTLARRRAGVSGGRAELKAPMPGKVARLLVAVGDAVQAGQALLLFEAMKMQNEIRAPSDGSVIELCVKESQAVEAGDKMLVLDLTTTG